MFRFVIATLTILTASTFAQAEFSVFSSSERLRVERSADEAAWKALGQKLIQRENFNPDAGFFVIQNIQPTDRSVTHQADWLTTDFLAGNEDGSLEPAYVNAISETWVKNSEGNWEIDQWFHVATRTGEMSNVSRRRMKQKPNGTMISYEYVRTGPASDPVEQAQWQAIKRRWFDWIQPR